MNYFKKLSISKRIQLIVNIISLVTLIALVSFIISKASVLLTEAADREAHQIGLANSAIIQANMEEAMNAARILSQLISGFEDMPENERCDDILKKLRLVHEKNPHFFGVWAVFEDDALGENAYKKGDPGVDEFNRFVPFWNRSQGQQNLSFATLYDAPGEDGYFYQHPKETFEETITEPYTDNIDGVKVEMVSLVVPVVIDNTFKGVIGIDISLEQFKKMVNEIKPYETGYVFWATNSGKFLAHPNQELVGKSFSEVQPDLEKRYQIMDKISKGESFKYQDISAITKNLSNVVYQPIFIGNSKKPWSFGVCIPQSKIAEGINRIKWYAIIIGLILLAISIFTTALLVKGIKKEISSIQQGFYQIVQSVINGRLDDRGNPELVGTDFKGIVNGANELIDAFVKPINVMAEYIDRVSSGNIPPELNDDYKGDFLEIKNNLNDLIRTTNGLTTEMSGLIKAAEAEQFNYRANDNGYTGKWHEVLTGSNKVMGIAESFLNSAKNASRIQQKIAGYQNTEILKIDQTLKSIADGDLKARYTANPGDNEIEEIYLNDYAFSSVSVILLAITQCSIKFRHMFLCLLLLNLYPNSSAYF